MPQNLPITTRAEEPYLLTVQLKDAGGADIDTTGWAARLRVLSYPGSSAIIEEESSGSKIALSTGLLAVSLLALDVDKLTPRQDPYVGEIELQPPGGAYQTAWALQWQHDAEGRAARPSPVIPPYTVEIGGVVIVATIVLIAAGDGHSHANKAVLDLLTDAGSGVVISAGERTKLTGIETGATADQTGAEIKALYEAEADTNAFTDAEQTKLAGIEASADVTDAASVGAAINSASVVTPLDTDALTANRGGALVQILVSALRTLFGFVGGLLGIGSGGTGASTAQGAINALTAVSGATAGHVLTATGGNASFAAPTGSPGGANTQIQFNDNGEFAGGPTWLKATGRLGIGTTTPAKQLEVKGDGTSVIIQGVYPNGTVTFTVDQNGFTTVGSLTVGDQGLIMGSGNLHIWHKSNGPIRFSLTSSQLEKMRIDYQGSVGIGSTAKPTANPDKVLYFGPVSADPTMAANTAGMYAKDVAGTVETFNIDSASNSTQSSPHATDAPDWMYDDDDVMPPLIDRDMNLFTGHIRFTNHTRNAKLIQGLIEGLAMPTDPLARRVVHEETFADYNTRRGLVQGDNDFLDQRDWTNAQLDREEANAIERAGWQDRKDAHDAAHAEWAQRPPDDRGEEPIFGEPEPAVYTRREPPSSLARLGITMRTNGVRNGR